MEPQGQESQRQETERQETELVEPGRRNGGRDLRGTTLRARLHSLLVAGLVLFVVVMGWVLYLAFTHFRQDALSERLLLARTVAQSLDSMVERSFQSMRQLPPHLKTLGPEVRGELRSFRFQSLFREAVFVLDGEGEVLVSDPPFVPAPFEGDPPGQEQVTPLLGVDGDGDEDADGARPYLAIAQPFQREGRPHSLVAEMNPRGSLLSIFLQSLAPASELHIVVIDDNARVIAASDQRHLFRTVQPAGQLGDRIAGHRSFVSDATRCSFCNGGADPEPVLTAMAPLQLAPWGVVVQQHRSAAFSSFHSAQLILFGVVSFFLAAGLVFSWVVSRSVVQPIQELSEQADRLRRGDLSGTIRVEGDREVRVLATTLDEARGRLAANLEDLRRLNENLEEQVARRTEKLRGQYDQLRELHQVSREKDAQRKALVRRLLHAGEEERRRIARELHDEISQLLTVIQLSLEEVPEDTSAMRKAKELLSETQEEVHRIIYDLRPSILDDLGLSSAVRWYARNYLQPRGLEVHLEVEEDLDLPNEVEITVFRIYQEIVTNLLRHSRAEHASIELFTRDSRLVLTVEDDGVGFSPGERSGGAGILGMRERADLIGGALTIESDPGAGTLVQLEIPLEPAGGERGTGAPREGAPAPQEESPAEGGSPP